MSDARSAMANQPEVAPTQGIPLIRSPAYREIYASNFRVRVTNVDASVVFVSQADITGASALQDEAIVSMPFSSLKILSEHLALIVQIAEQELGPIRVPIAGRPSEQNKAMLIQQFRSIPLAE